MIPWEPFPKIISSEDRTVSNILCVSETAETAIVWDSTISASCFPTSSSSFPSWTSFPSSSSPLTCASFSSFCSSSCSSISSSSSSSQSPGDVRTLWIGDLQYWMDENYISNCFLHTGEVCLFSILFVFLYLCHCSFNCGWSCLFSFVPLLLPCICDCSSTCLILFSSLIKLDFIIYTHLFTKLGSIK